MNGLIFEVRIDRNNNSVSWELKNFKEYPYEQLRVCENYPIEGNVACSCVHGIEGFKRLSKEDIAKRTWEQRTCGFFINAIVEYDLRPESEAPQYQAAIDDMVERILNINYNELEVKIIEQK